MKNDYVNFSKLFRQCSALSYLYSVHNYYQAYLILKDRLQPLYDEREAAAIAHELMYHVTGFDKARRLLDRSTLLTEEQQLLYNDASTSLAAGKPIQHVTGMGWFMGRFFCVNEHVLIPRPETEELVAWVTDYAKSKTGLREILDIGTGSGCVAVMLSVLLSDAIVTACDISKEALSVARKNAQIHEVVVHFLHLDFLDPDQNGSLGKYDIIVSNPPYIPLSEKDCMHVNVTRYEPAQALFVPNDDPLVFYKAIALFGKTHLKPRGSIFCEVEQTLAEACKTLFEDAGYTNVAVRRDIHGNLRMLHCVGV